MPDEGDCSKEVEDKWGVDDPRLLVARRREEMEYMRKMGVFEVVDEKVSRQWLQTSQTEAGGQDEGREMPFEMGLSGDQRGPRTETNNLDQKTYSHPCRRRNG